MMTKRVAFPPFPQKSDCATYVILEDPVLETNRSLGPALIPHPSSSNPTLIRVVPLRPPYTNKLISVSSVVVLQVVISAVWVGHRLKVQLASLVNVPQLVAF